VGVLDQAMLYGVLLKSGKVIQSKQGVFVRLSWRSLDKSQDSFE